MPKSIDDKRPPVMSIVPDKYAFVTPLGILNGTEIDSAAGIVYVCATTE